VKRSSQDTNHSVFTTREIKVLQKRFSNAF